MVIQTQLPNINQAMELPLDAVTEDSWWLEEAANATDEDSFGEFEQAEAITQVPEEQKLAEIE